MIKPGVYKFTGTAPGEPLPAFAWPGGYPVVYYASDGEKVCPACANGGNGSRFQEAGDPDCPDDQWTIEVADIYWEGPDAYCAHCYAAISSAYGDPDAKEPV